MIFVVYKEKNMKKSKIIVPALAMIAFSTAASIAGSVAWFTASRQVTISAGNYTVVKLTSNLDCTLAAGVGTTFTGKTVTFNGKLTDGSFNHKTKNIYTPASDGLSIAKETALPTNPTAEQLATLTTAMERGTVGGLKVYTAATFRITFTVNFGADQLDLGLFLNNTASKSQFTTAGTPITAKGFRMAIVPDASAEKAKVFADLQESGKCKYVAGTDNYAGTEYVASDKDLIDINYTEALPDSSTERATAIARPDFLGTIAAPSAGGNVSVSYTVVCWFEGTDENIVNRNDVNEYQTVAASLVFDAVDLKAA